MTQEINIDVKAGTSGAEAGVKRLETAADKAASAVGKIAVGAEAIADGMKKASRSAEQLKSVKSILEREKGKPFSDSDVNTFLDRWDRMRGSRSIGSGRLRQFDSFVDWDQGVNGTFARPQDARAHRLRMIQVGLQGTTYARQNAPEPEPEPEEPEQRPWWKRAAAGAASRVPGMASSIIGGTLAMAGIAGIGSMVGKANELFSDEAISINTLRRRMGDLGTSFDSLRAQTRAATGGLAVTYVESAKLANEFVRSSGGRGGIRGLRQGLGLSAAYGLENSAGVDFMATMQRLGVTSGNERENRKLANMIADAIGKSGYTAKADEFISSVQSFSVTAARMSLATPNVEGYASELSALSATRRPGMAPGDNAAMLATADAAQRQGGAFGEASLNFSMRAFQQQFGMRDPFADKALWQGGLFTSPRAQFGKGGPFAGWMKGNNFSSETVLSVLRKQLLRESGGSNELATEMASNQWNVPLAFARQLMTVDPAKLSKNERDDISKKFQQYQDPGQAILESTKAIADELTRGGGYVSATLNKIRMSVEALAQHMAPEEYKTQMRYEREAKTDFVKQLAEKNKGVTGLINRAIEWNNDAPTADDAEKRFAASVKAGKPLTLDQLIAPPGGWLDSEGTYQYTYLHAQRQQTQKFMRDMGFDAQGNRVGGGTAAAAAAASAAAELGGGANTTTRASGSKIGGRGISQAARALVDKYAAKYAGRAGMSVADYTKVAEATAMQESGMGRNLKSPTGVRGIMQVTRQTARSYGLNRDIPDQNVDAGLHWLADLIDKKHGDLHGALMSYNGGTDPNYADKILKRLQVGFHPAVVQIVDRDNKPLGQVSLHPFQPGNASGHSPLPPFAMGLGTDGG